MTRWHRGEAEKNWQRPTAEDAESSNQGKPGGRGGGSSRTDTTAVAVQLLLSLLFFVVVVVCCCCCRWMQKRNGTRRSCGKVPV